jgi:hypothetical protein
MTAKDVKQMELSIFFDHDYLRSSIQTEAGNMFENSDRMMYM